MALPGRKNKPNWGRSVSPTPHARPPLQGVHRLQKIIFPDFPHIYSFNLILSFDIIFPDSMLNYISFSLTHVANIKLTFDIMQTCQLQKTQTGRSIKKVPKNREKWCKMGRLNIMAAIPIFPRLSNSNPPQTISQLLWKGLSNNFVLSFANIFLKQN